MGEIPTEKPAPDSLEALHLIQSAIDALIDEFLGKSTEEEVQPLHKEPPSQP